MECDTFFPELRPEAWRLWSEAAPKQDNGMRYAFQCYVPASPSSSSGSNAPPSLPPAVAARHEEYQVRHNMLHA